MVSQAYREGQGASSYSDNPYDKYSQEYNDFERGYTQKLKRRPDSAYRCESGPLHEGCEFSELKGSKFVEDKPRWNVNSYAEARKK
ncbi:hypothetical protein [Pseudoalteromonas obscura]|uniref:Uncharacterized protein n=1 Tax=Pseudoalteromonas obscura TaxID=3048491 RepID=A0ABT7ESE7_9GAMM|nr:hypothetical protein [Pseudoalteromonas sp. P94(2023)]MDK2597933.1 hypothetical protein [Pseudoalteromonas sp. P94(2023)]